MLKEKWVKCWKINCTPPLEVYKTHINYFGCNIDIDQLDRFIENKERHLSYIKEAREIWKREFSSPPPNNN